MTQPPAAGPHTPLGGERARTTAEIHVIGDELLGATYPECNSTRLLRVLRSVGVRCRRVLLLPDEPEIVAEELRRALRQCDWVFTSGGIGPTHDDRTLEAVAAALSAPLQEDPRLLAVMAQRHPEGLNAGHRKMARVPAGCELVAGGRFAFPLLRCGRVFVLPGVPRLFEDKLAIVEGLFHGHEPPTVLVSVERPETTLKTILDRLVAEHPRVKVGSYPVEDTGRSRVEVLLEAEAADDLRAAEASLRAALAADSRTPPTGI